MHDVSKIHTLRSTVTECEAREGTRDVLLAKWNERSHQVTMIFNVVGIFCYQPNKNQSKGKWIVYPEFLKQKKYTHKLMTKHLLIGKIHRTLTCTYLTLSNASR